MDEATYILFENYLEGLLSEEERVAFEKRLEENAEFASHFETYREMSNHLSHQFSEGRSDLKSQLDEIGTAYFEGSQTEKKETKVIQFRPWQYGIAASIALLIGFFVFQNIGGGPEDYLFSEEISLTVRSDDSETLKQAETSFNEGSYPEAISHFDALLKNDPNNAELQFYKALAHDALKQFDEADNLFNELMNGTSLYKHKAAFYAGIREWNRGNNEKAEVLLKTIPETASEYKDAQRILKKL